MQCAVVPAQNEENRIGIVLTHLLKTPLDLIIPVINGCSDRTLAEVQDFTSPRIKPLYFTTSLGIDVPRAVGAKFAYSQGAETVLFVDGDMVGDLTNHFCSLLKSVSSQGVDMALTNCYPRKIHFKSTLAKEVLHYRKMLNCYLGLYSQIKLASPSHGPHAVSRRLLNLLPFSEIAIPPSTLAIAKKGNLKIKVSAEIAHHKLRSTLKDNLHSQDVARTIIGDCIEAWQFYLNLSRDRTYQGETFLGYHKLRRFDLLEDIDKLIEQGLTSLEK